MAKAIKPFKFSYVPAEEAFLDPLREDRDQPEAAKAVVIPFGLEASVSYGSGTAKGPQALIAASHQLELFDDELWREPVNDYGIATLKEPKIAKPIAEALKQLEALVGTVLAEDRFPLVIGGEHSLTPGAIAPFAARYKDLVVLQFDAHADLRDGYQGEPYSHAAAMRRVLDHKHVSLVSVGIRAISTSEVKFYEANRDRITIHWAHEVWDNARGGRLPEGESPGAKQDSARGGRLPEEESPGAKQEPSPGASKDFSRWDIERIVAPLKGRPVYLTFDIDALDPSIMPATGTPEPGGLRFEEALAIIRRTAEVAKVVGADIVELAPMKGLHAPDFLAAKLAYKMLSYVLSGTKRRG